MSTQPARFLAFTALSALLFSCAKPAEKKTDALDAPPPKSAALRVKVMTPKRGQLNVSRSVSGTVKASRDSNVAAQASGVVTRVPAAEGQTVRAGDVVVQLDTAAQQQALTSAQLQLQQAQINLQQTQRSTDQNGGQLSSQIVSAQASYDKALAQARANRKLYEVGALSQTDYQASEAALAQAKASLEQAKNSLAQNGQSGSGSIDLLQNQVKTAQASVSQAKSNLEKAKVRAPFDGTVASISVKEGEYVNTGSAVFRLVDPGSLSVDFKVPPTDSLALKAGSTLNFSYGGQSFSATVKEGDRVAGSDRLVPLSARLSGAQGLPVGSVGQLRYQTSLGQGYLLPSDAIVNDGGENAVYALSNGAARRVTVRVVAESEGQAAVSGLESGQQIIYPVPPSLQDGSSVKVTP